MFRFLVLILEVAVLVLHTHNCAFHLRIDTNNPKFIYFSSDLITLRYVNDFYVVQTFSILEFQPFETAVNI